MQSRQKKSIAATELAKMGVCEYQVHHKEKRSKIVRHKHTSKAIKRGNELHKQHESNSQRYQGDQRCYIATCVYGGQAEETQFLRLWRDERLMASRFGRAFITIYYVLSPHYVRLAMRVPAIDAITRSAINHFVNYLGYSQKDHDYG